MKGNIEKVVKKRKKALNKIGETINFIEATIEKLASFKRENDQLKRNDNTGLVSSIDLDNYVSELVLEKDYWKKIEQRFKRDTLNIGVVGKMGQGKSTFLQTVTALSDEEIPAKSGPACTSVQSVIRNYSGEEYAMIEFYSEEEFIREVIEPYYHKLAVNPQLKLNNIPLTINEFKRNTYPEIDKLNGDLETTKEGWYKNFLQLHKNINDYKDWLGTEPKKIRKSEIDGYVRYKYNDDDELLSHKYNAIKKVNIFTKFPNNNVENLGLIDIPGLGDFRLGDEDRLIRALNEDVDIIIFIRKPDADRNQWEVYDTELYDTANDVLKANLPLHLWSFMLINNRYDNKADCNMLKNTIESKARIRTVDCIIANCKDSGESINALSKIVEYLLGNIERLDDLFLENSKNSLDRIISELIIDLETISKSFAGDYRNQIFDENFDRFYRFLSVALEEYRGRLENNESINNTFISDIRQIISNCRKDLDGNFELPSLEEFRIDSIVEKSGRGVWDNLIHHIRPMILKQFHRISDKQQKTIDYHKRKISVLFSSEELFGNIATNKYVSESGDLLHYLHSISTEVLPRSSNLRTGFDFICDFRFSYEGYAQTFIYQTVTKFFSKEITSLETNEYIKKIIVDTQKVVSLAKEPEKESGVKINHAKKIIRTVVSGIQFISELGFIPKPVSTLISSIEEFGLSVLKLSSKQNEYDENTIVLVEKANEMESVFENHEEEIKFVMSESIKSLPVRIDAALNVCEKTLINEIGNWPELVSLTMIEEFIDHVRYTRTSEKEWRKLMYRLGKDIWPNYADIESYTEQVVQTRGLANSLINYLSNNQAN